MIVQSISILQLLLIQVFFHCYQTNHHNHHNYKESDKSIINAIIQKIQDQQEPYSVKVVFDLCGGGDRKKNELFERITSKIRNDKRIAYHKGKSSEYIDGYFTVVAEASKPSDIAPTPKDKKQIVPSENYIYSRLKEAPPGKEGDKVILSVVKTIPADANFDRFIRRVIIRLIKHRQSRAFRVKTVFAICGGGNINNTSTNKRFERVANKIRIDKRVIYHKGDRSSKFIDGYFTAAIAAATEPSNISNTDSNDNCDSIDDDNIENEDDHNDDGDVE